MKTERQTIQKSKCPTWDKNENVSYFLERLAFWDQCETHKGKYLDLIKSLQESGRNKEKERIENDVQNKSLNPTSPDIIKDIIECMRKWFGKTKADNASDSWDGFTEKKRTKGTNINDFLLDFETTTSRLQTVIPNIPKIFNY